MSFQDIYKIKNKLKEDYNFIKNDGNILINIAKDLLTENDNDYQKTLEFVDTLSKKDIQTRMCDMMYELETAGEISWIIKEQIKQEQLEYKKLKKLLKLIQEEIKQQNESKKNELEQSSKLLQEGIKQHDEIKKDLDKLTTIKDNLNLDLFEINKNIGKIFDNKYENEYNFNTCDYVLTYDKDIYRYGNINHIHYIDIDKFQSLVLLDQTVVNGISYTHGKFYKKINLHFKFPITIKLMENEFIVKAFLENHNFQKKKKDFYNNNVLSGEFSFGWYVIYITNFGRLIKSDIAYIRYQNIARQGGGNYYDLEIILESDYKDPHQKFDTNGMLVENISKDYPLIEAPKLLYRMPRIFLDVIDAFHTQNNDLMQESCKKYLSIARAKGTEKDIIDNIEYDRIIQSKDTIISEKDVMIKTQNETIEKQKEEIEKMKLEITKLKSALLVFTS
jgi:hypothetical protein